MFEKVKVGKYVVTHKKELDELMKTLFGHWNKIGQLDKNEKISNKMQEIFLIAIIKIWLQTAGMPKQTQIQVLKELIADIGAVS